MSEIYSPHIKMLSVQCLKSIFFTEDRGRDCECSEQYSPLTSDRSAVCFVELPDTIYHMSDIDMIIIDIDHNLASKQPLQSVGCSYSEVLILK